MALFEKKYCDFCGNKIGLLSEKKLKNGSMCKTCSLKLSPLYNYGITTTTEEIQEHLIYREKNKVALANFKPTLEIGMYRYFYLDYKMNAFISGIGNWQPSSNPRSNPDLVYFTQIKDCCYYTSEEKREIYAKDKEGNNVSFVPPQYEYSYNYIVSLTVNHPYFRKYEKQINNVSVPANNPMEMERYKKCCEHVVKTFRDIIAQTEAMKNGKSAPVSAPAPSQPSHKTDKPRLFCIECGEKLPEIGKFCPFCGTKI